MVNDTIYSIITVKNLDEKVANVEKELEKPRENPKNVRPEQLEKILLSIGFEKRAGKGSHAVYKMPGNRPLTVPYRRPFLLPVYVKAALKLIDEILENE